MAAVAMIVLAAMLLVPAVGADEVMLRNNESYNGNVVSLDGNLLVLHTQSAKGTENLKFPLGEVSYIEYNDNKVMVGAPPSLGAYKSAQGQTDSKAESQAKVAKDTVVLDGGTIVQCELSRLSHDEVVCGVKPISTYTRQQVWRVYFSKR